MESRSSFSRHPPPSSRSLGKVRPFLPPSSLRRCTFFLVFGGPPFPPTIETGLFFLHGNDKPPLWGDPPQPIFLSGALFPLSPPPPPTPHIKGKRREGRFFFFFHFLFPFPRIRKTVPNSPPPSFLSSQNPPPFFRIRGIELAHRSLPFFSFF